MIHYLDTDPYTRDRTYMVRLVNGSVESFGRLAQLADLYSRPVAFAPPSQTGFVRQARPDLAAAVVSGTRGRESAVDLVDELGELKALRDRGVLNAGELQEAKEKLLSLP